MFVLSGITTFGLGRLDGVIYVLGLKVGGSVWIRLMFLGRGDLIMSGKWIGGYVWFGGWSDDFIVNEILDLMKQAVAQVCGVTVLLVENTIHQEFEGIG